MKILLVEDDYLLAETTATLIQCLGEHQVYITDEPTEIFQHCQSGNIDVVMMDVNLPGAQWDGQLVSGADLSRLLKTQPQTANIPIVLVTAYALVNEKQSLLETSKADDFYSKPILDFESLLKGLDQLVKK
ncbi:MULTISPECIES: response regulator [unclassified Coleofasciculus]|uniref:response regulator n=1 Tax=unclassified Coleofasciculus TaxID=2692782 RepID=UPI00187E5E75|nr:MULTISPECIES: response regulator [unclassified Coleofasciculus]MBE9126276.1 response regulator [Coleofasciculus sp. LEGE 07081]MBE9149195.1 response regulator [Coleofasciculus sp. LEGE 07092]